MCNGIVPDALWRNAVRHVQMPQCVSVTATIGLAVRAGEVEVQRRAPVGGHQALLVPPVRSTRSAAAGPRSSSTATDNDQARTFAGPKLNCNWFRSPVRSASSRAACRCALASSLR